MSQVEVFSRQSDITGEGPVWSVAEQALYWIDIGSRQVFRRGPGDTATRAWSLPYRPGCFGEMGDGRLGIAMGTDIHAFDPGTGQSEPLGINPPMRPGSRFNDGKIDPQGRFWVGTMPDNFGPNGEALPIDSPLGQLFRIEPDGSSTEIEHEVFCSNTLAWSPDGKRFYFGDSMPEGIISSYDYDPATGAVSNKQAFFQDQAVGVPDGSAIDVDGCLWNARWGGGVVLRITPDGRVDRTIQMPVLRPTSCAFGGPNLDILYVTSATHGIDDAERTAMPLSGSVFAVAGVGQGLAVPAWTRRPA